jgi:hypothetical protein
VEDNEAASDAVAEVNRAEATIVILVESLDFVQVELHVAWSWMVIIRDKCDINNQSRSQL